MTPPHSHFFISILQDAELNRDDESNEEEDEKE